MINHCIQEEFKALEIAEKHAGQRHPVRDVGLALLEALGHRRGQQRGGQHSAQSPALPGPPCRP